MQLLHLQLDLLVGHPQYDVPGHQTRETRHEALVERARTLLNEGLDGAIDRALVLAGGAVHVARLHDIHRTRRQGSAESRNRRRCEVARHPIAEITAGEDEILDDIVTDYLRNVDDSVSRDVRHSSCV